MEIFDNLWLGLGIALTPANLLYCFGGVLLGTLVGILPGINPIVTVAMLLPLTFHLPPSSSLIMLAGIYYGAQYGGSTTAILVNVPGETSSVVTCLDGHQMARQGRAGSALAVAALSSLFAGCVATLMIIFLAPALVEFALLFGPTEYFALMVLGLVMAILLAHGSVLKALAMVALGLLLGTVGTDVNSGFQRMTFGWPPLAEGIGVVPLAMGLFAVAEIIRNLEQDGAEKATIASRRGRLWPTREDFRRSWPAAARGTTVGSALGILPGGGPLLSAFAAYILEKRLSKEPQRFGSGAVEGLAAPEAANNAGAQTSFIPLLTLGIPSNPIMAVMAGAMIIQGIQPGPQVMAAQPELFWGLIASMLIGNLMLVILNLPLIGLWVSLLRIPYRLLFPLILAFCCIGVYSLNNSALDVFLMAASGLLGLALLKWGCEPAPLILAFILGPLMEENFRRAMLLSRGDPTVFATTPVSLALLTIAAVLLMVMALPAVRRGRETVFEE